MIHTELDVTVKGAEDIEVKSVTTQNNIPIIEENWLSKVVGNNGFSKEREFQHIARVPYTAYLAAKQRGYNMDNETDVNKFLRENPEFLRVDHLHPTQGGSQHQIIIH